MRHLALILLFGLTSGQDEIRVSCAPEGTITTQECKVLNNQVKLTLKLLSQARGCHWSPVSDPETPWCYFPSDWGYVVKSIRQQTKTTTVRLERQSAYRWKSINEGLVKNLAQELDTFWRRLLCPAVDYHRRK